MRGSWLAAAEGADTAALTALRPELGDLIARFEGQATDDIGARLRSLLAARTAQLVGDEVGLAALDPEIIDQARNWPVDSRLDDVERAALDLCESFVMDVHSISDTQVERLVALLGNDGTVAVLMNLALLDGFTKFRRVFTEGDR